MGNAETMDLEGLLAEREKFALTLGSIGDGVITTDDQKKIVMMNHSAEKITGWNFDFAVGKPLGEIFKIIEKETKRPLEDLLDIPIDTGKMTGLKRDTMLISRNGDEKYVSASISPIKVLDNIIGIVIVFRDITRIRNTEEKLINEQKNLESIFNAAPIGMLLVDENTVIKKANKSMLYIIDRNEKEVINQKIGNGIGCVNCFKNKKGCGHCGMCEECTLRSTLETVIDLRETTLGVKIRQILLINNIPKEFIFKIDSVPVIIDDKNHVVLVIDDITEREQTRKELERAREKAEAANHAKSEFLANMSHEIRTPLNGMLGMIDLTLLSSLTKEQKDNLYIAKDCAYTLLNLINDILDFSKIEARKLTLENINFNFRSFISQSMKSHALRIQEKGLDFQYEIDSKIPPVISGDPNRLKQIINNLLGNATKFTESGEIKLLVDLARRLEDCIELKFQISDTGIGIDSKNIEGLFDTFTQADSSFTRKYGGSGLGLAISKQLIEMMEGRIWVESERGKGSTFYFTIKVQTSNGIADINYNIESINKTEKPLHILLVEDDKINQLVITRMIKEAGHFVETANNGIEALEVFREKNIDLILMDIQMPKMDGIETTKCIRDAEKEAGTHIPIIALTAHALLGDRERYLSLGMDEYIPKPIQINTLLSTIEKIRLDNKNKNLIEVVNTSRGINPKEFRIRQNKNKEKLIKDVIVNIKFLKNAIGEKDFITIEKYAHDIKELSLILNVNGVKNAAFKLELAARKENMDIVMDNFNRLAREVDKLIKNEII